MLLLDRLQREHPCAGAVIASLFAELLCVLFGLLSRQINLLTDLGDALVVARWFNVDDETLLIGGANDPPIRESQIGEGDHEDTCQNTSSYKEGRRSKSLPE